MLAIPEGLKVVQLFTPGTTDGAARTSDAICLKNVKRCWFVLGTSGGHATAVTFALQQATDVAIGTNKAVANAVPLWHNADTSTSDTLEKGTAAVSKATAAAALPTLTVFQIDPSQLDVANGYDCVYVTTLGAQALNLLSGYALCEMRYEGDASPSVIAD